MPSPIERTVPTSARSVSTSYCSIRLRRIDVISSGRSFKGSPLCPHEVVSQAFQSPADARVDEIRARLQDDAAHDVRIDAPCRFDLAARGLLDLRDDVLRFLVGELARGRQLDRQAALVARDQPLELVRDAPDLARASFLGEEHQEVLEERILVAREVGEDACLLRRFELRVLEDHAELGRLLDGGGEIGERLVHLRKPVLLLCRGEQRLGVDALRGSYADSSSREKSSEAIASLMSSRSRSASITRPTTRDAASSVSVATSLRICSSARAVSAAISLRVSASRRCRSASVSSRMRCSIDSRVLRASLRISSASLRACPINRRCSSSSLRASSRALSASSSERRTCSRRSSMSAWMRPNAYLRRTKKTIRKRMIVQIISPGIIRVSGLETASSIYLTSTNPRKPPTRP